MTESMASGCSGCPGQAGRALAELAVQYVPPEEWLFAAPDERDTLGRFSANAVRTAVQYFSAADPDSLRYGMPTGAFDFDFNEVEAAHQRLALGPPLQPITIARMQRLAAAREQHRQQFAAEPPSSRRKRALGAQPFLEEASADLFSQDPMWGDLYDLAQDLPVPALTPSQEMVRAMRDIFRQTRGIGPLHERDQLPFIVARQALQSCSGPWVCDMARRWRSPRTVKICPYGDRTPDYRAVRPSRQQAPNDPAQNS